MRSYFTKALAIVVLATLLGIPWGFYNQQLVEDASAMSQQQWLEHMEYSQEATANATGFTGTLVVSIIMTTGLVCIYEFIKLACGMIVGLFFGRSFGPDDVVTLPGL